MICTPQTIDLSLTAGQRYTWPVLGRVCRILTLAGAASVQVSFDTDSYQRFYAGIGYPAAPGEEFSQVRFYNDSGATVTLTVTVSDDFLDDRRRDAASSAAGAGPGSIGAIAQTGVGATQILTAAANVKHACVVADLGNTGRIWLGFENTVTQANSFADLFKGGSWREAYIGDVWACSENGTENVRAYQTFE
jgi:hypothetical protein